MYVEFSAPALLVEEVEETCKLDSPPQILIDTKSIQVENTQIIVDNKEDPFKDLGPNIVGNIIEYSSSTNEDEVEEDKKKKKEEVQRKEEERSANKEEEEKMKRSQKVVMQESIFQLVVM